VTGAGSSESELLALLDELIRAVAGVTTGLDDGFFEAGLTSAQLIGVLDRLQARLGRQLPVTELFQFPSRRALARRLAVVSGAVEEAPVARAGYRSAPDRRALRAQIRAATGARRE